MPPVPLRALASALGVSLVLLALSPLLGAVATEGSTPERGGGALAPGMEYREWSGTTRLHVLGVCLERSPCVGGNDTEAGAFFLGTGGDGGRIELTWRPVDNGTDVLRVRVAGATAEGPSPLVLDVGSLPAGTYPVEVETVRRTAGLIDQDVAWTASFYLVEPSETLRADGVSGFATGAACVAPLGCDPLLDQESSIFLLPWTGDGTLEARWDARSPFARELRISIGNSGLTAQGASPLELDLRALPPGEYVVRVEPLLAHAGLEQGIEWSLDAWRSA